MTYEISAGLSTLTEQIMSWQTIEREEVTSRRRDINCEAIVEEGMVQEGVGISGFHVELIRLVTFSITL